MRRTVPRWLSISCSVLAVGLAGTLAVADREPRRSSRDEMCPFSPNWRNCGSAHTAQSSSLRYETVGGRVACIGKEMIGQVAVAVLDANESALDFILGSHGGCMLLKPGLPVAVVERDGALTRVKLVAGDTSIAVWTVSDGVRVVF
jgi:hypothetical protein